MRNSVILSVLTVLTVVPTATASNRILDETLSLDLWMTVSDASRNRLYLADQADGSIVVLDAGSETVVTRIPVAGSLVDLALSKTNRFLAIASGRFVAEINLDTLQLREFEIPDNRLPNRVVSSVAYDQNDDLLIGTQTTFRPAGFVYRISRRDRVVLDRIQSGTAGRPVFERPLIRTDPTGTSLFVLQRIGTPFGLQKFDISGDPTFVATAGVALSNIEDFRVSPAGTELYVSAFAPSRGVHIFSTDTVEFLETLPVVSGPGPIAISPSGASILCATNDREIQAWSTLTREPIGTFPLKGEVSSPSPAQRALGTSSDGNKAFLSYGNSIDGRKVQVVDLMLE